MAANSAGLRRLKNQWHPCFWHLIHPVLKVILNRGSTGLSFVAVPSGKGEPFVDADEVARAQFTFTILDLDSNRAGDWSTLTGGIVLLAGAVEDAVTVLAFVHCSLESDISILSDVFTTPAAKFDSFRGVWGPCRGRLLL